jgi:hypothetical protein
MLAPFHPFGKMLPSEMRAQLSTIGWRIAAALFPGALGGFGLWNNLNDWNSAATLGQKIAGLGVLLYGPLGVITALALLAGKPLGRTLFLVFAAVVILVGGLSPVVWGTASPVYGFLTGLSTALFCGAAYWAASRALGIGPEAVPSPE